MIVNKYFQPVITLISYSRPVLLDIWDRYFEIYFWAMLIHVKYTSLTNVVEHVLLGYYM